MAEHTRKFARGTWVEGETTDAEKFEFGIIGDYDEDDGQHRVMIFPAEADQWEGDKERWCEPEDIRETSNRPKWVGDAGPTHAFVYEWMDDHVANVSLHAAPQDIVSAYFTDADEDERRSLQTKLMEAVMDPGERIELVPGGGAVRFCVVNG